VKLNRKGKIVVGIALAAAVGLLAALSVPNAMASSAMDDLGNGFVEKLQKKDVRGAYAMLSPRRRARMTLEEFQVHAEHVAFVTHTKHEFSRQYTLGMNPLRPRSGCIRSRLYVGDKPWAYQTFFVRGQGDDWYVESFAMQEPASTQLEELLEECRRDAGTDFGYHGPPVVNRLPRME
jgi:hypothetical protein